jgi:hypothetical protein
MCILTSYQFPPYRRQRANRVVARPIIGGGGGGCGFLLKAIVFTVCEHEYMNIHTPIIIIPTHNNTEYTEIIILGNSGKERYTEIIS